MTRRLYLFVAMIAALVAVHPHLASASPIALSFDINGTTFDAAMLNCVAGPGPNQSQCSGSNLAGPGFELNAWSFALDLDPKISGSFTLTNLSPVTQAFSVSASLGTLPVAGPLSMNGSLGAGTLTDLNGGGATFSSLVHPVYQATVDGNSVRSLLDPPQVFSIAANPNGGPGAPLTIPMVSFGPEALNQSVAASIGVKFESFSLTAGDSIAFPFEFDVSPASADAVPEPATLTLTALGLAGCATRLRRRRR